MKDTEFYICTYEHINKCLSFSYCQFSTYFFLVSIYLRLLSKKYSWSLDHSSYCQIFVTSHCYMYENICLQFLFPYKVDSQHPPVQRLMTPKPISIATNRTVYFKPSLTPSGELRKTNQRIDKKDNVSMSLLSSVFEY